MDIAGLLGTFASSLAFYIDEFDRILLHVTENLPIVGNQIESYVGETRALMEERPEELKPFTGLMDDMAEVRVPLFEIIIELQKQDIINQQLNHLLSAVKDVQEIINLNGSLFVEFNDRKGKEEHREDYRHLFTLIGFLLTNLEKQMEHINRDMTDLVDIMEQRFSDLHTKIRSLYNDRKAIDRAAPEISSSIQSILNATENLSIEVEQYSNFFNRLRILQDDLNKELKLCVSLKKEIDDYQAAIGGPVPLKDCRFTNTVIQKIVNKLSVEEERQTLREEYSELHIEEGFTRDVVLF